MKTGRDGWTYEKKPFFEMAQYALNVNKRTIHTRDR